MSAAIANPTLTIPLAPPVQTGVLDALALQMRAGGTCLLMLHPGGTISWHDPAAGVFFERYVIPLLRHPELAADELRERVRTVDARSPVQTWQFIPGVILAAAPFMERRQMTGVWLLAARDENFSLCEDVLRVCSRIGLDSIWLGEQATVLAPHSQERILQSLSLLTAMAKDKVRLASMDGELNSLSTQLSNAYEELALIDQISGGMRVNRRASEFFRQACLDVLQVLNVRGMGVALSADKYREEPVLYGQLSLPPGSVHRLAGQLLNSLQGRTTPLLINNLSQNNTYRWLGEFATQLIAVPLQRHDRLLGCIFGLDKSTGEFDSVDGKLLTSIANESAMYLDNAMLFRDVHELMMGLMHSLTSAVDAKDAYTCGHSERVALLSRHLATQIKLSDHQIQRIYMAGLLHDVGKIGVPESVLQKTGRLTPEEFEQMKKHPQIGARILADVKQLEDIIPGVMHHHERFDGRGYPGNLAGDTIPLMGRIICLADCLDAMTSNRTYRKALPLEVALNEIRRCSCTQFDPVLADAFLQITPDQFRSLMRDHQQQAKKLLEMQESLRSA